MQPLNKKIYCTQGHFHEENDINNRTFKIPIFCDEINYYGNEDVKNSINTFNLRQSFLKSVMYQNKNSNTGGSGEFYTIGVAVEVILFS